MTHRRMASEWMEWAMKNEPWTVVSAPDNTKPHLCTLPGFIVRRRLHLKRGSVVRCNVCGTYWLRAYDADGSYWRVEYTRSDTAPRTRKQTGSAHPTGTHRAVPTTPPGQSKV